MAIQGTSMHRCAHQNSTKQVTTTATQEREKHLARAEPCRCCPEPMDCQPEGSIGLQCESMWARKKQGCSKYLPVQRNESKAAAMSLSCR